jgi:uncharacterized membrane protein
MLLKSLLFSLFYGSVLMAVSAAPGAPVDPKLLPPPSTKKGLSYAADIQPIFAKSCYPCHSRKTDKPKGKLLLDSLPDLLRGGEDGLVLVAGDSAKSPLVIQVSHQGDPDDYMPPPKNKANVGPLTKEQIGLIRAWIDQGAK